MTVYGFLRQKNAWVLTCKRWHAVRQVTLLNLHVRASAGTSVLKDDVHQWSTSFALLMKNRMGRQIFTKFLEGEYSDENMLFWNACEEFKHEKGNIRRETMAKEIYGTFLAPSAPLEINIDSKTRSDLMRRMVENPTSDLFDGCQDHVYRLMERDCFRRFVQSNIYKEFVQQVDDGTILLNE